MAPSGRLEGRLSSVGPGLPSNRRSDVTGTRGRARVDIPGLVDCRALIDEVPLMIWLMDPLTLAITYRNRRSAVFVGEPVPGGTAETADGLDAWECRLHPEDAERYVAEVRRCIARGASFAVKFRTLRADGVYRWVIDQAVPQFGADGSLSYYLGSTLDITPQVEAEEELRARERVELERLRSLLPICSHCKRIRDLEGHWHDMEEYVGAHMAADFSHGLCPTCVALYDTE